jgi:1-acyl-sn-glycerol-3-phosphate acyltransferase
MQAGKIHTKLIIIKALAYTAYTCGRASLKSIFKTSSRKWCDDELQRWIKRLIKLLKIDVKIINPYNFTPKPNEATIIMCNHTSLFDIPLSLCAFPNHSIRMLAKKELAQIPIFGGGMIAAEFPLIDRNNRRQAIKDLDAVKKLLNSGIVMWIAPEGTRSSNGVLGTFKKGGFITAITTNAKIIPIGIKGASKILPARTKQFNLGQVAEIHIGEPIDASLYKLNNKDELISTVHKSIEKLIS